MNLKTTLRFGLFIAFCCLFNTHTWSMDEALNLEETASSSTMPCNNFSFTTEAIGVFCNEETGLIRIQITGGTAPFSIEWDNKDMSIWAETTIRNRSFTIDALPPGTYTIRIMDRYGCFLEQTQHLSGQVSTLDLSISNNSSPCDTEGSIAVNVGNSAPPYLVTVDGPNGPASRIVNENNFSIDNLPEGFYNITVRQDDCENTQSINVINADAPLALDLSEVATRTCDGDFGSIAANITGGHPPFRLYYDGPVSELLRENSGLTQSNGATLVQNLTPGTYIFTVIDAEMCTVNQTVTVNGPSVPAVTLETESEVDVCARTGNIWVTASGGTGNYILSYQGEGDLFRATRITSAGFSLDNLPLNTYVVSIEDEAGCTATTTIEVNTPIPDFQVSAVANRGKCEKRGSITVSYPSSGSFNVAWSGPVSGSAAGGAGSFEITDLPRGAYQISATNEFGCVRSTTVSLAAPEASSVSFNAEGRDGMCGSRGSILVSGISGTTGDAYLSWSGRVSGSFHDLGSEYVIPDLPAGTYTVTVMDEHGCSSSATVVINRATAGASFNTTPVAGRCGSRGSVVINGAIGRAPFRLAWTGPVSNSINGLGAEYTIKNLPAGRYQFSITDVNGCSSTNVVDLAASSGSDVSLATESSVNNCLQTGDIWVTPSGGTGKYTLTWSGGSEGSASIGTEGFSIAGVSPAHYTVTIMDENGCSATNNIEVSVTRAFLEFSIAGTSAINGRGGVIRVNFGNGRAPRTIGWSGPVDGSARTSGGSYDITDLPPGDYEITVTDADGCFDIQWITIANTTALNNLIFSATPTAQTAKALGFIDLWIDATAAPFTISWTGPVSGSARSDRQDFRIQDLPAGKYSITVTDRFGNYNVAMAVVGYDTSIQTTATGRNSNNGNITGLVDNTTLTLGQNYPNPFEGTTTIPFTLVETAEVTIQLHDNFGKLVKQVQNTFDAGVNQYELNSSDLGNGVYFYTLNTGTTTATKRMIIVK